MAYNTCAPVQRGSAEGAVTIPPYHQGLGWGRRLHRGYTTVSGAYQWTSDLFKEDNSSEESPEGTSSEEEDFWKKQAKCCSCWSFGRRAQIAREGLQAYELSHKGCPRPQRLPDGTWVPARFWGIHRKELRELYSESCEQEVWQDDMNVTQFVNHFVKPKTTGSEMGYALMVHQDDPQEVTLMISHAWVENAKNFFEDVLKSMFRNEVAFICFLSNFQGTPEQIDAQLGNDIMRSPFTQVINSTTCQRMLVVPNEELKTNGQGLYSRLWCIWEIKVAADAGLPIIILPDRSSGEHLLGKSIISSRNARCGNPYYPMNKDEVLIRAAIARMPPESNRSSAYAFFGICFCTSYGAVAGGGILEGESFSYNGMATGIFVGFVVGMFVVAIIFAWARRALQKLKRRDSYTVLDRIIQRSASGAYSKRRITADRDVVQLATLCFGCALLNAGVEFFRTRDVNEIGLAALSGMGLVVLLFFTIKVNLLGTFHGNFFVTPFAQCMSRGLILCASLGGAVFSHLLSRGCTGIIGAGANIGFLTGNLMLSCLTGHWKHTLGNVAMIGAMLLTIWLSPILWRQQFLMMCGGLGLLMLPDRRPWQTVLTMLLLIASMAGLVLIYAFYKGNDTAYWEAFCRANGLYKNSEKIIQQQKFIVNPLYH